MEGPFRARWKVDERECRKPVQGSEGDMLAQCLTASLLVPGLPAPFPF